MNTNLLLDQIRRLHDDRESGVLEVIKDTERIDIFCREGMVEAVSSNLEHHRLGHYLVRDGSLLAADLDELLAKSRQHKISLGEAAVREKLLNPGELADLVRGQSIELLNYAITNAFVSNGFNPGFRSFFAPARVSFPHLLLELSRCDPTPFDLNPSQWIALTNVEDLSHLPWYPQELSVLSELVHPNTISGLLLATGMPEGNVRKILGVLQRLQIVATLNVDTKDNASVPMVADVALVKNSSFPIEQLTPIVTNAVASEKLEVLRNESSFVSEQFKNLKVRVGQADADNPLKVIAVSSPESQEGKSLVSANLALSFSMDSSRRTVIVDCDLRNPTLDKYLGVLLEPGLLGYLSQSHLAPFCNLRRIENLFFLTTGGIAARPIELLSLGKMKELIALLKTTFDTIILDAPPFAPIADARVISGLCDGMILVVRSGKTSYTSLEQALKLVDQNKLLGVVFNDVKPMLFNTYHRYGYYRYGQYGGYATRKTRTGPKTYLES